MRKVGVDRVDLPKMAKHHRRTQDHSGRVGLVRSHNILGDVTASRLEQSIFLIIVMSETRLNRAKLETTYASDVASGHDTRTTDEGSANVRHNCSVQVRHHHDVKLLRLRDELHRPINKIRDTQNSEIRNNQKESGHTCCRQSCR